MSSEKCLIHFPRWMIHRGDRHYLRLDSVTDTAIYLPNALYVNSSVPFVVPSLCLPMPSRHCFFFGLSWPLVRNEH